MKNNIKPADKWNDLKKKFQKGGFESSVSYMNFVEETVDIFATELGINSLIEIRQAKIGYTVEYSFRKNCYYLNVPIEEIHNTVITPKNSISIRTNICHEMGHIYYEDPKFFNLWDKGVVWNLRNKVISSLVETRADIFANKETTEVFRSSNFDWIPVDPIFVANPKSDVDYTGYLPPRIRHKIGKEHTEYTKRTVRYLFDMYLSQFKRYDEIVDSIRKDGRILKGKKEWLKSLLWCE